MQCQTLLHTPQSALSLSLSLSVSQMPLILRVTLDPAEAGPWQYFHFLKNFPQFVVVQTHNEKL